MTKARSIRPAAAKDALSVAARLLAARPRSRTALLRLLEGKGFATTEAAAAVERCVELGYLNEHELARTWARDLLAAGHAPDSVVARLTGKALEESAARAAVDAEVKETGWDPKVEAERLLRKKRLSGAKAVRFLISRGFEEDVARRAAGFDAMS